MYEEIRRQAEEAVSGLLAQAGLKPGSLFVVGCSSSEILGNTIGKGGSLEVAEAVLSGILPVLERYGVYLAAQCCEHLNRALIIEAEAAEKFGCPPVSVVPWEHGGGSFATAVYRALRAPVAVGHVLADAGIDIGLTMIGMHLKDVAVPVRLPIKKIGEAPIVCARTRPKLIGGERARYS